MSTSSKLAEQFTKPLVVGALAALGSKALGENYDVILPVLGTEVSSAVMYGLVGMGSSLVAETAKQWVLPYIPANTPSMVQLEDALLAPALSAASNVAILSILYPSIIKENGYMNPLLIGFGSEIVGEYGYRNILIPLWMR